MISMNLGNFTKKETWRQVNNWPGEFHYAPRYLDHFNHIVIPNYFLTGWMFNISRPSVTNFATLSHIIGHEITHAFDSVGAKFDGEGRERDWWEGSTRQKYKEKQDCIRETYSNYTLEVRQE